ncbi:MAG: tRNA 2-thiouridine(34) synthase MnmA [Candidatus Yanofskybacteria bacterium RIFCSPHIGHO2_02_FULL_50_12]|uniref:tRNA-specific 2-thiouridylase MnmA n=1 Tax=Candidatus Yanofskybacteria bacterium RIFCSPHIGHO2_02_FULL_50_12 TaxID=1802685 RepID=A0A1F8FT32_9BACT|nr:MAG: tRNA 2-thiouridine(34) synthase MnmA [Candidatus Yanofskybacteria bacterium RIFCSPHIGHO2_02_FULL_50_12]
MNQFVIKKKVYVGMSGGVDSSVAAALLKKQGYDVVGVFMKPWQPFDDENFCLWKQDREDALRAASVIGIPLLTWDFSKEYKKSVADYMVREYRAGRTPNPDVMCNKEIKFGLFLKRALKEGADYIATGHYILKKGNQLWQAKDKNKDQSYFLWTLTEKQIERSLFPIGNYTKPEVRKLAKKFKLPNHDKKDSQGVCFIGPLDMKEFLTEYIKPKPGKILLQGETLKEIGTHDGVYYYTIGQRHGLNIGIGGGPYYVIGKDIKKNIIYMGANIEVATNVTKVGETNWLVNMPITNIDVKVRYRTPSVKAVLAKNGVLKFKKPERAITSGQSAVFYHGQQLLGGGIIL